MIHLEGDPKVKLSAKEFASVYLAGLLHGIWADGATWRDDVDPACERRMTDKETAVIEAQLRALVKRCYKVMETPLASAKKKSQDEPSG